MFEEITTPMAIKLYMGLVLATMCGCTKPNPSYDANPALPDECRAGEEVTQTFRDHARPEKLDILFVVDASSDNPAALQALFARAMAPLGELLDELELDVRSAVTTTDAAATGLAAPGVTGEDCGGNDVTVASLAENDWASVMRCNVVTEPSTEPYDQPLVVVEDVLIDRPDAFPRNDARLFVVVATLSDDCSTEGALTGDPREACPAADLLDVTELIDRWRARVPSPDAVGLAVFAGPPSRVAVDEMRPVCSSTIGSARPGNRLFRAAEALGGFGSFHSICTDDVTVPLLGAVEQFVRTATATICPGDELVHEPLAVFAGDEPVPLGLDGFTYVSSSATCPGGGVQFAGDALRGVDDIEITYCIE